MFPICVATAMVSEPSQPARTIGLAVCLGLTRSQGAWVKESTQPRSFVRDDPLQRGAVTALADKDAVPHDGPAAHEHRSHCA